MLRSIGLILTLSLLVACSDEPTPDELATPKKSPQAVLEAKAGTYEGAWQLFGLAADGSVSEAFSFTDVAVADQPTFEETRAYLRVTDSGVLDSGFEFEDTWREGVMIEADGSAGQEFMERQGVVTLFVEIEPHHFQYEQALTQDDFFLIAPEIADAMTASHHVVDKRVTFPDGVETHDITRTTHIEWTDETGAQTVDYVSLEGKHEKVE